MIKIVFDIGSGGRAARQRSAKPRTAVRIRFRPQHFLSFATFVARLFCFRLVAKRA
jgi:hypothetical protein